MGAEKGKTRPVVVVRITRQTTLVVAVTDARKRRLPTHVLLRGFDSGTSVKDALVTCEHAWSLDPSRLSLRAETRSLSEVERRGVGLCLRVALSLVPSRAPPAPPKHPRGAVIRVDFSGGMGAEAAGIQPALVVSNDAGNYYGRTMLVAPLIYGEAVWPSPGRAPAIDLGRLRVIDRDRVRGEGEGLGAEILSEIDEDLEAFIPWGVAQAAGFEPASRA